MTQTAFDLSPRSLTGRLLAQLAHVAANDAAATADRVEAARLDAIASELFAKAAAAGQRWDGTDYVFGDLPQPIEIL